MIEAARVAWPIAPIAEHTPARRRTPALGAPVFVPSVWCYAFQFDIGKTDLRGCTEGRGGGSLDAGAVSQSGGVTRRRSVIQTVALQQG